MPIFVAGLFFVKFLMNESAETKANLPKACLLMILSVIITAVYIVLGGLASGTIAALIPTLVALGITGAFWFYGKIVTQRYADA